MTVLIVMGVSGSGKTTVGLALARRLGFEFMEGDEFHSRANREKMRAGLPLNDADRQPWLDALSDRIGAMLLRNGNAVVTCSALKQSYRDVLGRDGVRFIYLRVSMAVARERLALRKGHFFNPALLESQFATLEEPRDAMIVDVDRSDLDIVNDIAQKLSCSTVAPRPERRAAAKT